MSDPTDSQRTNPSSTNDGPYVIEVEAGTKAFCQCGRTGSNPYCDGSHHGCGIEPRIEKFDSARKLVMCGCGRSEKTPFCDGSHSK